MKKLFFIFALPIVLTLTAGMMSSCGKGIPVRVNGKLVYLGASESEKGKNKYPTARKEERKKDMELAKQNKQRFEEQNKQRFEEQRKKKELERRKEEEKKRQIARNLELQRRADEVLKWKRAGFAPQEAEKWIEANFALQEAEKWKKAGFSPKEAGEWGAKGFDSKNAKKWKQQRFTPQEAREWTYSGIEIETASVLKKRGISPDQKDAIIWVKKSGDLKPEEKKIWENSGYSYEEIMKLIDHGVTAGDIKKLKKTYYSSDELIKFISQGASVKDIMELKKSGYSHGDIANLMKYGAMVKDIPKLKRECPDQIYEPGDPYEKNFFGMVDPYDVKGKCYFYSAGMSQRLDRHTALFKTGNYRKWYIVRLSINGEKPMPRRFIGVVKGGDPYKYRTALGGQNIVPSGRALFYRVRD